MIVLPKKELIPLKNIIFCIQCGILFNEKDDTKDHGVCSLECGYKLRGLHWSDFIDSPMDEINHHIDVLKDLGKY